MRVKDYMALGFVVKTSDVKGSLEGIKSIKEIRDATTHGSSAENQYQEPTTLLNSESTRMRFSTVFEIEPDLIRVNYVCF